MAFVWMLIGIASVAFLFLVRDIETITVAGEIELVVLLSSIFYNFWDPIAIFGLCNFLFPGKLPKN